MQNEKRLQMPAGGLGALFLAAFIPACGGDGPSGGFQAPRETPGNANLNSAGPDRFNMPPMASGANGTVTGGPALALEWDLPAGWAVLPTNNFRQANFSLPGNDQGRVLPLAARRRGRRSGLERRSLALADLAAAAAAQ